MRGALIVKGFKPKFYFCVSLNAVACVFIWGEGKGDVSPYFALDYSVECFSGQLKQSL